MRARTARLGFLLFLLALISAASFGWYWLTQPYNLPIKNVRVVGKLHFVSSAQLQKIIMPAVSKGFFNISVSRLHRTLMNIPGIKSVEISRTFPSSVTVQIKEKLPVATYRGSLVDSTGRLFKPLQNANPEALPAFKGSPSRLKAMVANYQKWSKALASRSLSIASLIETQPNQWSIKLGSGATLYLGSADLNSRLNRFVDSYPNLIASNPKKRLKLVDLRYEAGFAARWGA